MRRPRTFAPISFAFLLAGVCLSMAPAYAQEAVDEKKVIALFAEAREAFVAGDYATACPKYEEVVRLKPGLGARIGLGDCYRAQGRLARAWETYKAVVEEAPSVVKRAKSWSEQSTARKRGEEAQARIKEVQPRIAFVVLVVPEAILTLPDVVVQLDGITLDKARFGVRLPVDKGDHVVDVSAPGKKAWGKNVTLGEGAEYSVAVEPLEDDVPPVKVTPPDSPGKTDTGTNSTGVTIAPVVGDKPPPDDKRPPVGGKTNFFGTQRIAGLSLGAVGVGAVVAGAALGLHAIDRRNASEADGNCEGNRCNEIGLPLRQASYDAGNASTGLFIGGGVALAAGALLFLTAPKRPAAVQATVVLGPSSLHCIGRF